MRIITVPTDLARLWETRDIDFTEMMKIVVEVGQGILAIDADMHADLEQFLLENGSAQQDLWGANIYPFKGRNERLEFTSFINIRPSQGNRSMEIGDNSLKQQIEAIVNRLII